MHGSLSIRELFKEYGDTIDGSLRKVFSNTPQYELYGHMAYFMGLVDESFQPINEYGGKRFRSSLCLMIADWLGNKEAAIPIATSLELFHNFTLIHDDIVDGDTYRRGRKTVWNVWGKDHAINSGDVQSLLVHKVLVENKLLKASQIIAIQSFLLCQYIEVGEGQYLDFTLTEAKLGDKNVTEEVYFEMIGRKTAALIAASTKAAGLSAGVSDEILDALFQYGYNLGIAYQLCDDNVSIWGSSEQTGKRAYGDVLEKKKTLPILWAYATLDDGARKELSDYYNSTGTITPNRAERIIELLDSVHAYEHTKELVDTYAQKAKAQIEKLPIHEEQKETLAHIVDSLLPDIKRV